MSSKLVSKWLPSHVYYKLKKLGGEYEVKQTVIWTFPTSASKHKAKKILERRGDLIENK